MKEDFEKDTTMVKERPHIGIRHHMQQYLGIENIQLIIREDGHGEIKVGTEQ